MTQNTVFQCVKNIFFPSQKKLVFFTEFNLNIIHNIIVYEQCQIMSIHPLPLLIGAGCWLIIGTEAIESSGARWRWRVSDVLRVVAVMEFLIHHRLELFSNYAPLCFLPTPPHSTPQPAAQPSSKVMTQPDQEPSLPISTPSPTGDPAFWIHGLYKAEL